MPRFHAPKLFMGAAALGPTGLMQADIILVTAERRLIERADEIIVLADSSKFAGPSGHVGVRNSPDTPPFTALAPHALTKARRSGLTVSE